MSKGGPCEHRRCQGSATGCKALTDEEMKPGPEDEVLAEQLVAEGWLSVSNKYMTVARHVGIPTGRDLVRPELQDTSAGRWMMDLWDHTWRNHMLRMGGEGVETRTLTRTQYAAFRAAGGKTA